MEMLLSPRASPRTAMLMALGLRRQSQGAVEMSECIKLDVEEIWKGSYASNEPVQDENRS